MIHVNCISGNETFFFWENYFDIPALVACRNIVDQLDRQVFIADGLCSYFFEVFEINFFYSFVVALCDLVLDMETIFHLCQQLTTSGNIF